MTDAILAELGWWSIADHFEYAKVNYWHRLRIGGIGLGLASWMWRVRMGDAWYRIYKHRDNRIARSLGSGNIVSGERFARTRSRTNGYYERLNSVGTSVAVNVDNRCDSDGDDYDDSNNDSKRSAPLPNRVHDVDYVPDDDDNNDDAASNDGINPRMSIIAHRRHRLPTAFCEAAHYLLRRHGCDDQWWMTQSSMPMDIWRNNGRADIHTFFAKRWYNRVCQRRRGKSIYLRVQNGWPHYFVSRHLLGGTSVMNVYLIMIIMVECHGMMI